MFFHLHLQCKPQLHEEVFAFTEVSLELHENRTPSNFCKKEIGMSPTRVRCNFCFQKPLSCTSHCIGVVKSIYVCAEN